MKIFEETIKLDNVKEAVKIIPFGDIHIGAAGVNIPYLKNTIDWIKNTPNCYAIGMGDYCDCIDIKDKRFDIKAIDKKFIPNLDNIAMAQMEYITNILKPISKKILCMIPGNHEDKLRTRYSIDVMRELEKTLNINVGDYMSYLRLRFNKTQFHASPVTFWLHHGWFAGRKMGGKINQLSDVSSGYDADVYIAGHSHDLFATTSEKISLPVLGNKVIKSKKIFINSGTFMETVSENGTSYSEQKAYSISKIGTARLDIYPNHRPRPDLHVRI
jgi:predicted phosphodiesterase